MLRCSRVLYLDVTSAVSDWPPLWHTYTKQHLATPPFSSQLCSSGRTTTIPFKQWRTQLVLTKILLPPPSQVRRRPVEGPPRSAQLPPQTQIRRSPRSARNHLVLSKILLPPPSQVRRGNLGGLARIAQLPPPSQLRSRRNQKRRRRMLRILETSLKIFHS